MRAFQFQEGWTDLVSNRPGAPGAGYPDGPYFLRYTEARTLHLRATQPFAVWGIDAEGELCLLAVGTEVSVEVSLREVRDEDGGEVFVATQPAEFKVSGLDGPNGPTPVNVQVYDPPASVTVSEAAGESFTNIDRMPDESGPLAEVTRALRMLELEKRAALEAIRAARDAARLVEDDDGDGVVNKDDPDSPLYQPPEPPPEPEGGTP